LEHSFNTDAVESWLLCKGLHIVHLNIHYVLPKLDEIKIILSQNSSFECLCLCETFLDGTVLDSQLSIPGYSFFRKDRPSLGGGLLIYIKDMIFCHRRTDLEPDNIESLWLEFKLFNTKPILLCYSYRPPSSKVEWVDLFSVSLDRSFNENKETIVLGDFNFDLLKSCINSKPWLQLMESLNFTQLVTSPTRITDRTSTLIDHVFTNKPQNITEINIPSYALSDHFPVAITRKCSHNMVKAFS